MSGVSAECAARYEPRQLLERFYAKFGGTSGARVAAAPGRANLIGEHTDYQEGLVLPFAIEQRAFVVFRAKAGASLFAYAEDLDEFAEFDLGAAREDAFGPQIEPKWLRYVVAPFVQLGQCGGCELFIASQVPSGGGVSSSSALVVASTLAAVSLNGAALHRRPDGKAPLLMLACEAEWRFSGLQGGIMDHFASLLSKEGCAVAVDCRTAWLLNGEAYVRVDGGGVVFLVANTHVTHSLVDSAYSKRRASCEGVCKAMASRWPERSITHLRDASDLGDAVGLDMIRQLLEAQLISLEDSQRAQHGVSENNRVRAAIVALRAQDWPGLGALLNEAHGSLSKLYDVSCPELDIMCDSARNLEGCHGARMMGGGFGGCAVALCDAQAAPAVMAELRLRYKARTALLDEWRSQGGIDATIFASRAAAGAAVSDAESPQFLRPAALAFAAALAPNAL